MNGSEPRCAAGCGAVATLTVDVEGYQMDLCTACTRSLAFPELEDDHA